MILANTKIVLVRTGLLKALVLYLLLPLPAIASAEEKFWPSCATPSRPTHSPIGEPPQVRVWKGANVLAEWPQAGCVGRASADVRMLIALAGRFREEGGVNAIASRFGQVSMFLNVRYWSVSEGQWEPLSLAASALDGPDLSRRRENFTGDEVKSGRDLFFALQDYRSAEEVIYRLRAREARSERLVIEIENVTPVRFYLFQLFQPGDLRSIYFLDLRAPGVWDYYSLLIAGGESYLLRGSYEKSYINRAAALFRHVAGILTEGDIPLSR